MSTYKHTQPGYVILASLVMMMVIMIPILLTAQEAFVPVAMVIGAVVIILLLFSTLTVEIGGASLTWYFGPGLLRWSRPLAEIAEVQAVRNRWWYGYGIRALPSGWLYNVSGLDAVEITLKSGRRIRIGTDEPEALLRAVQDSRQMQGF